MSIQAGRGGEDALRSGTGKVREPRPGRPSRSGPRGLRPGVEAMEARVLLAKLGPSATGAAEVSATGGGPVESTGNAQYLTRLETLLAGGPLPGPTHAALLQALNRGRPRDAVVRALLRTPQGASERASDAYAQMVGEMPTADQAARLGSVIQRGGDLRRLVVRIASGPAYDQAHGGTNAGLVAGLYEDLLGRAPTGPESTNWVARLDRGGSRLATAQAMIQSSEGRDQLAAQSGVSLNSLGISPDPVATQRTLRRPTGMTVLVSQYYGSDAYFAKASAPRTTPPPTLETATDPRVHPPGLPMAPGQDLGTHWTPLAETNAPTIDGTNLVSAASDGTIWLTGATGAADTLYTYVPPTPGTNPSWTALPKLSYTITSLSAVSKDLAWAIGYRTTDGPDAQPNYQFSIDGQGHIGNVSAANILDGNYTAVAAALDGTILNYKADWGFSFYPKGQSNRTILPPLPPSTPDTISVGSESSVWVTATPVGSTTPVVYQYVSGGWQPLSGLSGPAPTHVAATADGSVWAWTGSTFYLKTEANGTWEQLTHFTSLVPPGQTPPPDPLVPPASPVALAPISQYRIGGILADNTVQVLNVGVTDQPAVPFPAIPASQQAGYDAISAQLQLPPGTGGIRGQYENLNFSASGAEGVINTMAQPPGISAADWTALKSQLVGELDRIGNVDQLFKNLETLNTALNTQSDSILQAAYNEVQQGNTLNNDGDAVILFLADMVDAVLWGVSAGGLGPAASVLTAVAASAFGSATPLFANGPPVDNNATLETAYSDLQTATDNYFKAIATQNAEYETAILGDWARLQAVNEAALGPWYWNPENSLNIEAAVKPAYNLFYYQALMPAKWQAVYHPSAPQAFCNMYYCYEPAPPSYDLITINIPNTTNAQYWYLNQLGGSTDLANPFGVGPVPTQGLLNTIYAMGVSQQTLFSAQDGWNLKFITVS